jgi:hypothetical protein
MPAAAIVPPATKTPNRSIEARRSARAAKVERERLIVDCLNRGVAVAEIATRIGVTEKRTRALMREILAGRAPAEPEEFAAVQVARLNEALAAAYAAMSPDNLRAVALVVRIVGELDRYHGFDPAGRRASRNGREIDAMAEPQRPASGAESPSQTIEKAQNAPGNGTPGDGPQSPEAAEKVVSARSAPAEGAGRLAASAIVFSESAPQRLDKARSAPGSGAPAAPLLQSFLAASAKEPPTVLPASPAGLLHATAAPQTLDPRAFRRAHVRTLLNGVSAC